ncbi:MAG: HDOD domain-containing protein, partial [candidate division Zixibacteria bacterium]
TAKVLKLSNSSFYGRSKEVQSLEEAVLILGFFNVRSIVVATAAHSLYGGKGEDNNESKLWRHSLLSAVAARQVARHVRHPAMEELFIAALLHDIGKLVLMQKVGSRYKEIIERVEAGDGSFVDLEAECLKFNHCDVAEILLDAWSFPPSLTDIISGHHELPELEEGQQASSIHIIDLSNQIAKLAGVGFADQLSQEIHETKTAQAMSLDAGTLDLLTQEIMEYYQAEINILEGA